MNAKFGLPQELINAVSKVLNEAVPAIGDGVKVTQKGHEHFGKEGVVKSAQGNKVNVHFAGASSPTLVHHSALSITREESADLTGLELLGESNLGYAVINKPGHPLHDKKAKIFHKHADGRVNAQVTMSNKKGDVINLTLDPKAHDFKMVSESTESLEEGAVERNPKQKIYVAYNSHGSEVSRHTTREAAEAQAKKYGGQSKLAEETIVETPVSVTRDSKGKLISWKNDSEWRKRTKKDARGVVTHDSDKARKETEKLTKEETELTEANFPGDIRSKHKLYKDMGFDVVDSHVGTKDGKDYAHYTVIDKEGVGRKHIIHGDSRKVENLGQVRGVKDDTDADTGEKVAKRRGRPPKDKFAQK